MKRTQSQNSGYWLVVDQVLDFYKQNEGAMVMDLMRAVKISLTKEFTHHLLKLLFLGKSTTKLDTGEMSAFMMNIKTHFAIEHDVDIRLPNEPPLEKLIIDNER